MSVPLILSSGFLFLGGIALLYSRDATFLLLGIVFFLLGVIPLLLCYVRSLFAWYKRQPFSFANKSEKEDSHEDS